MRPIYRRDQFPNLARPIPELRRCRDQFPKDMQLEVDTELTIRDDTGQARYARVDALDEKTVTLNFNHPLAGDELHFHVKVVALREPNQEELDHGHVHEAGHHH